MPEALPLMPVDALARPEGLAAAPGLWRYAAAIPVDAALGARLSMGEGGTAAIAAGDRDLAGVTLKLEYLSPTGSFKDRGAAVLVASALERGAQALIADSSGNAGSAIAAYAARAALPCRVFVPDRTSAAKQAQIRAYGAELELVAGDRTATAQAAAAAVAAGEALYASHVHDPYFLQGTKTFALELWEHTPALPDALVVPAGNGTLLLGAAIGFAELAAAGLVERVPALVAVQTERCAPLAQAWRQGATSTTAIAAAPTLAEGIAIPDPARGAEMLAAVRASGGCVVSVPESAIRPAQAELAGRGLLVEATAAVPWAATLLARAPERLGREFGDGGREFGDREAPEWAQARELLQGTVVVPLCGAGLKGTLDWVT